MAPSERGSERDPDAFPVPSLLRSQPGAVLGRIEGRVAVLLLQAAIGRDRCIATEDLKRGWLLLIVLALTLICAATARDARVKPW